MAQDDEAKPGDSAQAEAATSRVEQVKGHLSQTQDESSTSSRRRRKTRKDDELPADYSDLLGQMKTMRKMANTPDLHKTGYVRQKEAGKLWVRDHWLDRRFDPAGGQPFPVNLPEKAVLLHRREVLGHAGAQSLLGILLEQPRQQVLGVGT